VSTSRHPGRGLPALLMGLALVWAGVACASPAATPAATGDAANGVTIDNGTDAPVTIVYERPDEGTDTLADLAPGAEVVIDEIFKEREGLCRTGRLVALAADGTELDELYLVCRGRTWTVEAS